MKNQMPNMPQGLSAVQPIPSAIPRCSSCVLPRSSPILSFNDMGVCNICVSAAQRTAASWETKREDRLNAAIEEIRRRGQGRPYDCLVGLSGGRDSSYLIHLLVRKHGLRCLAAYYRTPFTHDVIDANVHRITKTLDVPLVSMNISQDSHRRLARKFLLLWARCPMPEYANLVCVICKFVNREAFRIARKHRIRSVVYAGNNYEDFQFGAVPVVVSPGRPIESLSNQLRKVPKIARKGTALVLRSPGVIRHLPTAFKASILYLNPHSAWLRFRYPDIFRIDYFFLTPWKRDECLQTIRMELGWELPPGCNSTWKADCSMEAVKNFMFRQMYGITYAETFFSNMIRDGAISREEALKRLDEEGRPSAERLGQVCQILDLPSDYFAS